MVRPPPTELWCEANCPEALVEDFSEQTALGVRATLETAASMNSWNSRWCTLWTSGTYYPTTIAQKTALVNIPRCIIMNRTLKGSLLHIRIQPGALPISPSDTDLRCL